MINMNANISSINRPNILPSGGTSSAGKPGFGDAVKAVGQAINKVDAQQQQSDMSVQELLSGKGDLTTVVSEVAKSDMSFKLLVGVRNKLIEAYKQTMNMQI